MSGYTDDLISQRGVSNGSVAFISEPLTPEPLLAKIDELLAVGATHKPRSPAVTA